jgi:hypothetical protein
VPRIAGIPPGQLFVTNLDDLISKGADNLSALFFVLQNPPPDSPSTTSVRSSPRGFFAPLKAYCERDKIYLPLQLKNT